MVEKMRAALFREKGQPLTIEEVPLPEISACEVLLKIRVCGVCRTDLHIFRGELTPSKLPLIMGHQIIGEIIAMGSEVKGWKLHQQVGVPWLGKTCGKCRYCVNKQENLCDRAQFTGFDLPGGFAEYTTADAGYIFPIPKNLPIEKCAPLFCPGFIGLRALHFVGDAKNIGFYGYGASARILMPIARYLKKEIYVFTKPGDLKGQEEAKKAGAVWAGASDESAPLQLESAIIFASAGELIPKALKDVCKGGRIICAGIHMSAIPSFPYSLLWGERSIQSVANLTRKDGKQFLSLTNKLHLKPECTVFPFEKIQKAFTALETGTVRGSPIIHIS